MNRVVKQMLATGSYTAVMVSGKYCPYCKRIEDKLKRENIPLQKYMIEHMPESSKGEYIDCYGQSLPYIPETAEDVDRIRSLWNRGEE